MAYAFDGATKRITLSAGTTTLDLTDLHSRWKDWVRAGNAECLIAFGAVGGDIPAIPLYLFLKNGWKIVPQSADHVLNVTGGVLETDDGTDAFVDPVGTYKIRIYRESPGIAIGYTTGSGVTAQDKTDIINGVWAHASALDLTSRVAVAQAILQNRTVTDPTTGVMTVFADDGVTPLLTAQIFEDTSGAQPYRGQGVQLRGRLQ